MKTHPLSFVIGVGTCASLLMIGKKTLVVFVAMKLETGYVYAKAYLAKMSVTVIMFS